MKKTIAVLLILFPFIQSFGQIDSLREELNRLKLQNDVLKDHIICADKKFYEEEKKKLNVAITLGFKLTEKWKGLQNSTSIAAGQNRISQIKSIGSDNALGLNFEETLKEMIQNNLTDSFENIQFASDQVKENTQNRWKQIVNRILNNGVVQDLVNTNPFTSVASTIINSAIGFTKHDIDTYADIKVVPVGDLPKKYKNYRNEWKDKYDVIGSTSIKSYNNSQIVFTDETIKSFSNAIEPYIKLYDKMGQTTLKFEMQLEELKRLHIDYKDIISTYDKKLLEYLDIQKFSDMPDRIYELTNVNETADFPLYRKTIEREELTKARNHANQYSLFREKVNELNIKFYDINIEYFKAYADHLNMALDYTVSGRTKYDKVKILKAKEYLEEQIDICKKAKSDLLLEE
jgi:hypothetical protein